MTNVRWVNGIIDYKLLELGMFGGYESTSDSSSDNDFFFPFLLRKSKFINGDQLNKALISGGLRDTLHLRSKSSILQETYKLSRTNDVWMWLWIRSSKRNG